MIKAGRLFHNLVVIGSNNLLVLLRINNRIPINFHPFPFSSNSRFSSSVGVAVAESGFGPETGRVELCSVVEGKHWTASCLLPVSASAVWESLPILVCKVLRLPFQT